MSDSAASIAIVVPSEAPTRPSASIVLASNAALIALLLAAVGVPISLLWDFSWESTVGIDSVWAAPHAATYASVALAGLATLVLLFLSSEATGVRLGPVSAPLGGWMALWGSVVFPVAFFFDRWWQANYGLAAGIWHPPQILKAVAFFSIVMGAWMVCLKFQNQNVRGGGMAFAASGGLVLAMISVVTLTGIYPNRQHSGAFYQIACASYPLVLTAIASAGKLPWSATLASALYMVLFCAMMWLLPLFPARPQVPPIYNSLDHMLPPPFPLLLILPAAAMDALLRRVSWRASRWLQALAVGVAFFVVFAAVQWIFAEFLLTNAADNRFFAGGGRHWPFFLKIDPLARVQFWNTAQTELNLSSAAFAIGLAIAASRCGLAIGEWMKRVQR